MAASDPHDQRVTEFLAREARELTATVAGGRPAPPVVLLARARRAFAVVGVVSTVLADHALPAREAYGLGVVLADEACAVLDPVIGPELITAYRADLRRGEAVAIYQRAEFDLTVHGRIGGRDIDDALAALAGALTGLLEGVVTNERALPGQRSAARAVEAQARELWAQYGGDAGGW